MKIISIVLLIILSSHFSYSQKVKFLEENTSESVKFAPVYVVSTKQWYFTDSVGIINFPKSSSPFTITIEAMGYEKLQMEISDSQTIYLKKSAQTLSEVIVRPKKYKPKFFETENGKMNGGYSFIWQGTSRNFGTVIHFTDNLIWLNKIIFSAINRGNPKSRLVRFKLYKFKASFNNLGFFDRFPNNEIEEIYSYELKDVFNNPAEKWVTFNMPSNIVLEKGYYFVSFQLIPNGNDKLSVKYSNDKFVHSYYNYNNDKYWRFDRYKLDGKYYNMKVKIEYDTN